MDRLKVSLAQLDVRLGKPEENISRAMNWIDEAAQNGSNLILFPELWSSGYDLEHIDAYAQVLNTGLWDDLAHKAASCHIAVGGTLLEKSNNQYFNTSMLFSPGGEVLAIYRKIHLFTTIDEHRFLTPGDQFATAEAPWGKTGLATCYDLRFPELFRHYALDGARIILLPAEWPSKRLDHWRILIRARAIENQLFVIAVNAVGSYKSDIYAGHSAVISPWGETLVEAGAVEALLTAEIDLADIDKARARIPVFEDRRPDLY
jgi:predicted amidohydrolase